MIKLLAVAIGLAVVMLMASTGVVAAQGQYPPGRILRYAQDGLYEYRSVAPYQYQDVAPDSWRFHRSGTRGRLGLGADPLRPEGPGNASE